MLQMRTDQIHSWKLSISIVKNQHLAETTVRVSGVFCDWQIIDDCDSNVQYTLVDFDILRLDTKV